MYVHIILTFATFVWILLSMLIFSKELIVPLIVPNQGNYKLVKQFKMWLTTTCN